MLSTLPCFRIDLSDAGLASVGLGGVQARTISLFAAMVLLVTFPFDVEHLSTMILGALMYFAFDVFRRSTPPSAYESKKLNVVRSRLTPTSSGKARKVNSRCTQRSLSNATVAPVVAPTFRGTSWESEVGELLSQIAPTPECERTVAAVTHAIKKAIWQVLPEADVVGFTTGNLQGGKAFSVAVPDVHIVANIEAAALIQRMTIRTKGAKLAPEATEARQLQKYALRICSEKLMHQAGFKFRRSAFGGGEPKVTLMTQAKSGLGSDDVAVPLDFCVNSQAPLCHAKMLNECGAIEPRALALILLVKRWAKDRGICFTARGHLSPYAWTVLVIHFLQVFDDEAGPLLPPLPALNSGSLKTRLDAWSPWKQLSDPSMSVAGLLKNFFNFYANFDWNVARVSVLTGLSSTSSMDNNVGQDQVVRPCIEDPFAACVNLSTGMNEWSVTRFHEELKRASRLCAGSASLSNILEPWSPDFPEPDVGISQ